MGQSRELIIATFFLTLLTFTTNGQGTSTFKGFVIDKGDDPLVGCSVNIKGTSIGTLTDICGEFSIPVGQDDFTIVFHDMTYEDLRTFELGIKKKEITGDKIVFQIGRGTKKNKNCKQTIDKRLKKYRIE